MVDLIRGTLDYVKLSDGTLRHVAVHSSWRAHGYKWEGTTVDLSQAYKQLAINPEQMWCAAGVIHDCETSAPMFFAQNTLPFGAAAS
eukprot:2907217-Amphidinium_carterae.1